MANTAQRAATIEEIIGYGVYFTINLMQKFGKTTTLCMIWRSTNMGNETDPQWVEANGSLGIS